MTKRKPAKGTPPAVAPRVPAGYSGTPLPKKLGIKAGQTVLLLGAPDGFESTLGSLPEDVRLVSRSARPVELVILFAKSRADLAKCFPASVKAMAEGGGLWISWPKKASGVLTDLTENDVRGTGLKSGLVDYKICAIDETWSGLKFARRRV